MGPRSWRTQLLLLSVTLSLLRPTWCPAAEQDDLDRILAQGYFVWGADEEGGGPYVYPDPENPQRVIGFEVELAEQIARQMGAQARFQSGIWANLPDLLRIRKIDLILNGYELTPARAQLMDHTIPYYVYDVVLMVRVGDPSIQHWEDLKKPIRGRKPRVAVLVSSGAHLYLEREWKEWVEIRAYDGNVEAMRDVETHKVDATVVDRPIAIFYKNRYPNLRIVGEPKAPGYYVIYVRKGQTRLRAELDRILRDLIQSGRLREIYDRYGLWTEAQDQLYQFARQGSSPTRQAEALRGWRVIVERGPILLQGAWTTFYLSVLSFPLAVLAGACLAVVRLFGPWILRVPVVLYVELIRGTPLMLQLYFVFYVLPELGVPLQPIQAAIVGLALNYAAYESEIFRAGIQAVPAGQIQAALALGMSWMQTLRRVVLPQAFRIVVPPMTNDFIALFKDTSVCSVITIFELTRQYSVQRNDTGATLELALLAAGLYLVMSVPLSRLAIVTERRLHGRPTESLRGLRRIV
jgi:polar amino acid transport system substrate-binding protein